VGGVLGVRLATRPPGNHSDAPRAPGRRRSPWNHAAGGLRKRRVGIRAERLGVAAGKGMMCSHRLNEPPMKLVGHGRIQEPI
jgi:hypothetical protein